MQQSKTSLADKPKIDERGSDDAEREQPSIDDGSAGSAGSDDARTLKTNKESLTVAGSQPDAHEGSGGSLVNSGENWLPAGFRYGENGAVEYRNSNGSWVWLSTRMEIVADVRNGESADWGRLIRFLDPDGSQHEVAIPMSMLAGSGQEAREKLMDAGLRISTDPGARNAFNRLLLRASPPQRKLCVSTLGWHAETFVRPDEVIGAASSDQIIFQTDHPFRHNFRKCGSLEGWQRNIALLAVGNSRLVGAVSAAFAAPMLRPLGLEGGGIHLRGLSSSGKTTVLEVAGSACGGGPNGYHTTWRSTDNGLEAVAAVHNDGLLVLDEMSQVPGHSIGEIAYMLGNGQGKMRASRNAAARQVRKWLLLYLSSGEISLSDKMREARHGAKSRAGQEVRILDVPADAGADHGVFEELHGFESGHAFADHLKSQVNQHYGHALLAFLQCLIDRDWQELAKKRLKRFRGKVVPDGSDGQVHRAAERFGALAVAGEFAAEWRVVPWPSDEATTAAERLFGDWLDERGGPEAAEIAQGIRSLRLFLELHGTSRFAPWDHPFKSIPDRAGFYRVENRGTLHFVFPEVWRHEILEGQDMRFINSKLVTRGILKTNLDRKSQIKVRLPDGSERKMYVVVESALTGAAETGDEPGSNEPEPWEPDPYDPPM